MSGTLFGYPRSAAEEKKVSGAFFGYPRSAARANRRFETELVDDSLNPSILPIGPAPLDTLLDHLVLGERLRPVDEAQPSTPPIDRPGRQHRPFFR